MAPEQARGKSVDRRADIWAFGVVLYEMLTRRRAFEGDDISDVARRRVATGRSIGPRCRPALPPPFSRLLASMPRKGSAQAAERDRRRAARARRARAGRGRIAPPRGGASVDRRAAVAGGRGRRADRRRRGAAVASRAGVARRTVMSRAVDPAAAGRTICIRIRPASRSLQTARWSRSSSASVDPDRRRSCGCGRSIRRSPRRLDDAEGASLPFWSPDSRRIGFFTARQVEDDCGVGRARRDALRRAGRRAAPSGRRERHRLRTGRQRAALHAFRPAAARRSR